MSVKPNQVPNPILWRDTGCALAWSVSGISSGKFFLVGCDPSEHIIEHDEFDQSAPTEEIIQSLFDDTSFTVAKIEPSGEELLKNNVKDALESEDIKLFYESESSREIVGALGQPRPSDIEIRYEVMLPSPPPSILEQDDVPDATELDVHLIDT